MNDPNIPGGKSRLTRRRFLGQSLAAAAVSSVAFSFPGWARGAGPETSSIRITSPSAGSAGSVWSTVAERFVDPALSQGLDLQWITANPGKMQVQLAAGTLDVGVFGTTGLATLLNRGRDIVLFGPALNNHGRWLVKADSPYQKPEDLIGKRIATVPETSETFLQARIAASLNGIDLKKDTQLVFGPPMANLALFERGDVDAVISLEPTATRLIASGAREIARVGDQWSQATGGTSTPFLVGLAAHRRWLDQNRQVASRLARLFSGIGQSLQEPSIYADLYPQMGIKDSEKKAIELLGERMPSAYAARWDQSVWDVIDRQLEVAVQLGILDKKPERPLYDGVALENVDE